MLTYQRYGIKTLSAFLRRYAPSNENNTELYIKQVCEKTGLTKDSLINTNEIMIPVLHAMAVVESGSIMPLAYIKESIAL